VKRRRWPVRYQFAVIVVAPLLALAAVSAWQISGALRRAAQAREVKREVTFAASAASLLQQLQRERGLSAGYLGSGYRIGLDDRLLTQRAEVDAAAKAFDAAVNAADSETVPPSVETALDQAETALLGLAGERRTMENQTLDLTGVLAYYTGVIGKLLAVDQAMSSTISDPETARIATAFVDLSEGEESAALEAGFMHSVFYERRFGPGDYGNLLSIVADQASWLEQFRATAAPEVVTYYDQHVAGPAVNRADTLLTQALAEGAQGQAMTIQPADWWSATTAETNLMSDVGLRMIADLRGRASAAANGADAAVGVYTAITLLVMGLSFALSTFLSRRMARALRGLRDAAHDAADVRLPAVVAALGEGRDVDVAREAEPVHIHTNDEIGDTAHAFNRVHDVAMRLTVEQAGLRRSLGDTLLNLAHRSQTLIHQQLELIDEMERSEADGARLASLFRIDHLATRMRRHTEDLIVLSGATPSRGWSAPVPMHDVVRGAVAEVESYSRVTAIRIPEVAVVGHAVGDLVHLLAELIENGARFSPPHTPVTITAAAVSRGYAIEIEDRGLGMTPADLARYNERLADPPVFDLSTSDRLGLHVVGQLAARRSIRVSLRDSAFGGVTAVVLVGPELIRPIEEVAVADEVAAAMPSRSVADGDERNGAGMARPADGFPDGAAADRFPWPAPAGANGLGTGVGDVGGAGRPEPARDVAGREVLAPLPVRSPGQHGRARRSPTRDTRAGSSEARRAGGGPAEALPGPVTADGLPRRVPRQHLAPELRRDSGTGSGGERRRSPEVGRPSPEEIQELLSGYQSGFERGRSEWRDHSVAGADGQVTDRAVSGSDTENVVADRVLDHPQKAFHRSWR
jgi:signal transduction histidine kinase